MRIIEPSFKVIYMNTAPLHTIESAGRTCYKSKEAFTKESQQDFVKRILLSGHHSVIEHVSMSARIVCDRGVSHEIVRHRLASYSQESTRYCNYSKEKFGSHLTFIKPLWCKNIPDNIEIRDFDFVSDLSNVQPLESTETNWIDAMLNSEIVYFELLKKGWQPQQARSVLPNSLKTEIVMTCNVREWRHFFTLRTAKAAHPQMREIAQPMLDRFKELVPIIFDDINY